MNSLSPLLPSLMVLPLLTPKAHFSEARCRCLLPASPLSSAMVVPGNSSEALGGSYCPKHETILSVALDHPFVAKWLPTTNLPTTAAQLNVQTGVSMQTPEMFEKQKRSLYWVYVPKRANSNGLSSSWPSPEPRPRGEGL